MSQIYIAYGSETGNAEYLAHHFQQSLSAHGFTSQLSTLNQLPLSSLQAQDYLFIFCSNFGDGEAPGNATEFYQELLCLKKLDTQFIVFGLGDVSYPKFCGFTQALDEQLRKLGATAIGHRVDADTNYKIFFNEWQNAVLAYLNNEKESLQNLILQVKAYDENSGFEALIHKVTRINQGEFPIYDIDIDITGSDMCYSAGDLLYLIPPANQHSLQRINHFYGGLSQEERLQLEKKELRLLTKSLFRSIAKKTKNKDIKALIKISATKEFNQYIYGRDIADVLSDFCTTENMPINELLEILSDKLPRAYSIASCGQVSPNIVKLCVREVNYQLNNQQYYGSASHFLCQAKAGDKIKVYIRSNPHFQLPEDQNAPLIMIGAGTGIAPYLGFLQQKRNAETHLFFGERYRNKDFIYQEHFAELQNKGHLTQLHTAFSRDQAEKIYVQNIVEQQSEIIWRLLQNNGHIYICGSKNNLSHPLDEALQKIMMKYTHADEEQAQQWLYNLVTEKRLHKDLY